MILCFDNQYNKSESLFFLFRNLDKCGSAVIGIVRDKHPGPNGKKNKKTRYDKPQSTFSGILFTCGICSGKIAIGVFCFL